MGKKYTTGDRLKEIMEKRHLRQVDLLEMFEPYCKRDNVTISKAALSQWIHNKNEADQKRIAVMAEALNVDEGWLNGYDTTTMERRVPLPGTDRNRLVNYIMKASDEEVTDLINILKAMRKEI